MGGDMRHCCIVLALLSAPALSFGQQSQLQSPIIDVHMHGGPGRGESDQAFLQGALTEFDKYNVVLALTGIVHSDRYAETWRKAAPGRIVVGPQLAARDGGDLPDVGLLKQEYAAGRMGLLGELGYVYVGIAPTDPRLAPYFALAEEHDVPVTVHTGFRPPPKDCCPNFNNDYGNPALLKPILERHPRLRLIVFHVGGAGPNANYFDAAIALMKAHANVYADMSVVATMAPREVFYANLRRLIDEGLLSRIMFGSDGPRLIGPHVAAFEAVPFLTSEQKRDIYYNNAARFLRLTADEIARHHRR